MNCAYQGCDRPGSVLTRAVVHRETVAARERLIVEYGMCAMHSRNQLARAAATRDAINRAVRKRVERETCQPPEPATAPPNRRRFGAIS